MLSMLNHASRCVVHYTRAKRTHTALARSLFPLPWTRSRLAYEYGSSVPFHYRPPRSFLSDALARVYPASAFETQKPKPCESTITTIVPTIVPGTAVEERLAARGSSVSTHPPTRTQCSDGIHPHAKRIISHAPDAPGVLRLPSGRSLPSPVPRPPSQMPFGARKNH
jgi:hypothetical protein